MLEQIRPPRGQDPHLHDLARLAALALDAPLAVVVVDSDGRVRLEAGYGLSIPLEELNATLRGCAFCSRLLEEGGVVSAREAGEAGSALALELGAADFLGAAFPDASGFSGLVLVLDRASREWSGRGREILSNVARLAAREVRRTIELSAQQHADAERRAAEAHYRRLVETSPYGIYVMDLQGRFTELNPAAESIVGRSAESLIGRHFSDVVAHEDLELVRSRKQEMLEGTLLTNEMELRIVRPDGEQRLVHVRASAIREGGATRGTHGVLRDITQERAREKLVHRAERLATVGTLLSGVAHELNNPLNAVKNFAQLMLLDPRSDEDREALEIIQSQAERAAKIVADLRLIARQTRETPGSRDVVDLNGIVEHVLRLRRYTLQTGNISVVERLADNLPPVWGDRTELEQALLHLILNAEQALSTERRDRKIEVRTQKAPDGVQIQVSDTGPGIAPENLDRVFDPFWTTKPPGEGTGLGLSLVHRIVADHGGEVRVRSEPGSGAAFTITLPRVADQEEESSDEPLGQPIRSLNVLVVDDEAPIRTSIARFLRRRGHGVQEAAEGGEALLALSRGADFDVILTDLRMPGIGGEELLERLRSQGEGLDRRVVVITGHAGSADARRIMHATGAPTLLKPVKLDEVARAIEEHAERLTQEAERG